MRTLSLFPFLGVLILSCTAFAEYRVFELIIRKGEATRTISSTLDPLQYPGYYVLSEGETVEYQHTWMCRGRTDNFLALCPNPHKAQFEAPTAPAPLTP